MGQLLERMERQAVLLDDEPRERRYDPITDVTFLAREQAKHWRQLDDELRRGGDPVALIGGIAGIEGRSLSSAATATTASASEQQLWNTAIYSPIAKAAMREGACFELFASGRGTTGATPGTWTLTPRFGTSTGGVTLGASAAITLTASITGFQWLITGRYTIRDLGDANNSLSIIGSLTLQLRHSAATAGAIDATHVFGFTAVTTGDPTADQGLFIGSTASQTTTILTPDQICWGSWN